MPPHSGIADCQQGVCNLLGAILDHHVDACLDHILRDWKAVVRPPAQGFTLASAIRMAHPPLRFEFGEGMADKRIRGVGGVPKLDGPV